MEPFSDGNLTIVPRQDANAICLEWCGRSNARHPLLVLAPFFETVTSEAKNSGAAIEMRFDTLDEMNSSTMTVIIQLIQRLKADGIPLTLIYDASQKWQKLSFEALHVFQRGGRLLLKPK
jgi:hypothetical protein